MKSSSELKTNWEFIRVELKKRYPQLREADLKYIEGYENELFRSLGLKLAMNREQLLTLVDAILMGREKTLQKELETDFYKN